MSDWTRIGIVGLVGAVAIASAPACGGGDDDGSSSDSAAADTFVAFNPAFAGFHQWTSFPATSSIPSDIHVGPLTVFINKVPPKGSTSFPVGTIIVKEVEDTDLPNRKVFAMVKRGGGFNAGGAKDWEWFELQNVDEDTASYLWRGVGPPTSNEAYGGDPNACNACHGMGAGNDFVLSDALRLSSF